MEEELRKRPFLVLFFSFILFLVSLLYTKVKTAGVVEAEGHRFKFIYVAGQNINGQALYIPVYKELKQ